MQRDRLRSLRHPENDYHRPPGPNRIERAGNPRRSRVFAPAALSLIANLPSPRYLLSSLLVFPEFCDLILATAIAQILLPAFIHPYRDPSTLPAHHPNCLLPLRWCGSSSITQFILLRYNTTQTSALNELGRSLKFSSFRYSVDAPTACCLRPRSNSNAGHEFCTSRRLAAGTGGSICNWPTNK